MGAGVVVGGGDGEEVVRVRVPGEAICQAWLDIFWCIVDFVFGFFRWVLGRAVVGVLIEGWRWEGFVYWVDVKETFIHI